mgnify:CR=1 FL=1
MSLWGNSDADEAKPKWLSAADKKKVLPVKDQPVKGAADVVKSVSTADKPKPTREKLNPEQKTIRKFFINLTLPLLHLILQTQLFVY